MRTTISAAVFIKSSDTLNLSLNFREEKLTITATSAIAISMIPRVLTKSPSYTITVFYHTKENMSTVFSIKSFQKKKMNKKFSSGNNNCKKEAE